MINGIRLLLLQFLCFQNSRADLQAENLMLRHQIGVLRRSTSKRVRTTRIDRLWFVWLYRLWPNSMGDVQIIHPKTLVRWHRQGCRAYWRWKSRSYGGRPKVSADLRAIILQMGRQIRPGVRLASMANCSSWGSTPARQGYQATCPFH